MRTSTSTAILLPAWACIICISSVAFGQETVAITNSAANLPDQEISNEYADYFAQDGDFQLASLLQQPAAAPRLATAPPTSRPAPTSRPLSNVPNMFGDAPTTRITGTGTVNTDSTPFSSNIVANFP